MTGANFTNAILKRANFSKAKISGANFSNADLTMAQFRSLTADKANFTGASLNGTIFNLASFTSADFTNAKINGVKTWAVDIDGASKLPADWQVWSGLLIGPGSDIYYAAASQWPGGVCPTKPLPPANASKKGRLILSGAKISGAPDSCPLDFSNATLVNADLGSAYLRGANLSGANLTDALLGGELVGVNFSGANLTRAKFSSLRISENNFGQSNLTGSSMKASSIFGILDLSTATLTDFSCCGVSDNGDVVVKLPKNWRMIDNYIARPLTLIGKPSASGIFKVGKTLTLNLGKWEKGVGISIQWNRNGFPIPGAMKPKYKIGGNDRGQNLSATVSVSKLGTIPVTKTTKPVQVK